MALEFVERPPKALLCRLCSQVMRAPVVALACGHSFCEACVASAPLCPDHGVAVEATIANDLVAAQTGALLVICPCGSVAFLFFIVSSVFLVRLCISVCA